jgi:hypothetical protein
VDCPDDGVSYFGAWLGSAEQRKAQDEENLVIGNLVEPLLKSVFTEPQQPSISQSENVNRTIYQSAFNPSFQVIFFPSSYVRPA